MNTVTFDDEDDNGDNDDEKDTRDLTLWSLARSFEELQGLMLQFLQGELPYNPWFYDKIDKETVPLLKNLRKVNELGLVSLQGQPGVITPLIVQRSFIEGFCTSDTFAKIWFGMKAKYIIQAVQLESKEIKYTVPPLETMDPDQRYILLTKDRESELDDWREYTTLGVSKESIAMWAGEIINLQLVNPTLGEWMISHCWHVSIVEVKQGENHLLPDLIRALKK
jgi:hypothetical protein